MLEQIALIIGPLFLVAGVGAIYGWWRRPNMEITNRISVEIFIPILVFYALSGKNFDLADSKNLWIAGVFVIFGSGLLAWPVAKLTGVQARTLLPPMMFTNAGNLALPLAFFAFGERGLAAMVVLMVVENTLHFTVGIYMMDRRIPLQKLLLDPFIVATVLGLAASALDLTLAPIVDRALGLIAQVGIPLMLFSLGVRLIDIGFHNIKIGLLGGALCPLTGILFGLIFIACVDLSAFEVGMVLIFAALPPAVTNFIIAERFDQEPEKVAAIVFGGHLVAVVVMPIVLFFALHPN